MGMMKITHLHTFQPGKTLNFVISHVLVSTYPETYWGASIYGLMKNSEKMPVMF